jgi:hypothetical protein
MIITYVASIPKWMAPGDGGSERCPEDKQRRNDIIADNIEADKVSSVTSPATLRKENEKQYREAAINYWTLHFFTSVTLRQPIRDCW